MPVLELERRRTPARERPRRDVAARGAGRALDVLVAALGLLLISALLLLIAAAIRLDSRGPAIFRQVRRGRDGREFTIWKFRTMQAGTDPARHKEYVTRLINGDDRAVIREGRPLYKLAVDDRITRLGRILRAFSLDELPQLVNVLRGHMSLVGPRPLNSYEVERLHERWLARMSVKPGMTGLWQVSGRNQRTYTEMVELDLEYVRRKSLGLDLLILLKTPFTVITRKGAA